MQKNKNCPPFYSSHIGDGSFPPGDCPPSLLEDKNDE